MTLLMLNPVWQRKTCRRGFVSETSLRGMSDKEESSFVCAPIPKVQMWNRVFLTIDGLNEETNYNRRLSARASLCVSTMVGTRIMTDR